MTEVLGGPATERIDAGPDWVMCPACAALVWGRRWERDLRVCGHCGHHARLSAQARLDQLLDPGGRRMLEFGVAGGDPLGFTDSKPYPDRLLEARMRTGLDEAVLCARGEIGGHAVVAAVMDFAFMGGSLGGAVGELITLAADESLRTRTPLLIVTASGGARMQEGAVALMQMAKTAAALGQLDEAGVPTVSLITDPTFGGVAASFATLCDVIVAEPRARLGFAGPRVIMQTVRQSLPEGFQTAEFLLEHGLVDIVTPRSALRTTLGRLLSVGTRSAEPDPDPAPRPPSGTVIPRASGSWETVRRARRLDRPTTLDYFGRILDDFVELHGDRQSADCPAIVGGFGRLGGVPIVAIGHQKGHTIAELDARRFGMPSPAGYRKAARLMRIAAKLGLPVVTLVDTPGAHPGIEAEEQGQAAAIAENLRLMAALPVPVVTAVTGEGGSGGALALAVADRVLIFESAVYSVISPEGCAAILWHDAAAAPAAAAAQRLTPLELLRLGVVDAVVAEPEGGPGRDPALAAERLGNALGAALAELGPLDPPRLVAERRARFRRFTADMAVEPAARFERSAR